VNLNGANALMGEPAGQFDGHTHVFEASLPMPDNRRYTPRHDALLPSYLDHLHTAGLGGAILVQPSFLGMDNSYLLDALTAKAGSSPFLLRGVVTLGPQAASDQISRLDRAGVMGMRLNLFGNGPACGFDVAIWKDILRRVSGFGWHVDLHCEGHRLAEILPAILRHADRVVIDHFGLPDPVAPMQFPGQTAILAAPPGRVFVKASAPYRVFREDDSNTAATLCEPIFNRLLQSLGPEQLLWGSDWPWTQFQDRHTYSSTLEWGEMWLGAGFRPDEYRAPGQQPPDTGHPAKSPVNRHHS